MIDFSCVITFPSVPVKMRQENTAVLGLSHSCRCKPCYRHDKRFFMKYSRVIGIDPDVDKSGVAEVHVETRKVNMASMAFPQLMDYLQYMQKEYGCKDDENMLVVVEAGWMNANNWHTSSGQSVAAAAKTGQNTGRNHEVARKIAEMARHYGMNVVEVKPLKKCWKGRDGKITHEELSLIIGGIDGRTNQEVRDACVLSWVYAGLPIRLKCKYSDYQVSLKDGSIIK